MWSLPGNMQKTLLMILVLVQGSSWVYADNPERIVSLDLCTDWMLLTYADPRQVLALSPLSRQFHLNGQAHNLNVHDGSLEQVLALEADVVISGEFNAPLLRQRLQALGVRVVALPQATTLQEVRDYEQTFAKLIGYDNLHPLSLTKTNVRQDDNPSLLLLGANAGGTGTGTLEHEIINAAGWKNYVNERGYITLNLEQLVANPPDAIMWSAPASQALAYHFKQHPALKKVINKGAWLQTDFGGWQCQGPWTWQRINQLQQAKQRWLDVSR
jgi:iron complex transport system substrate-binding protein